MGTLWAHQYWPLTEASLSPDWEPGDEGQAVEMLLTRTRTIAPISFRSESVTDP
jgi:hypothetical protein